MAIRPELMEILICPRCRGQISFDSAKQGILCQKCELLFPVKNDIPVMLEDEAFPIREGGEVMTTTSGKRTMAVFEISEGKNKGQVVKLAAGSCKAIGRSLDDVNKTQVFSMDFTMALDDFTKKLIMNYIAKKSPNEKKSSTETSTDNIGNFKRLPDLVLDDPAISRLHAMIFHDSNGAGILDLVSKNGTYVNGEEVESKSLQNGDLVEVGGTKMVFAYK